MTIPGGGHDPRRNNPYPRPQPRPGVPDPSQNPLRGPRNAPDPQQNPLRGSQAAPESFWAPKTESFWDPDVTTEVRGEPENRPARRSRPGSRSGPRTSVAALLMPLVTGVVAAVTLGVYGRLHTPATFAIGPAGFSSALSMKAWLTTGALVFAIVQVGSARLMYAGPHAPAWAGVVHRWSGRIAFLLTIPVVFHCLYTLGLRFDDPRVMIHSLLGCFFYGVFVAKMLALPKRGVPGWGLPVLGGLLFTSLVGLWLTSSLWFFTTIGVTL